MSSLPVFIHDGSQFSMPVKHISHATLIPKSVDLIPHPFHGFWNASWRTEEVSRMKVTPRMFSPNFVHPLVHLSPMMINVFEISREDVDVSDPVMIRPHWCRSPFYGNNFGISRCHADEGIKVTLSKNLKEVEITLLWTRTSNVIKIHNSLSAYIPSWRNRTRNRKFWNSHERNCQSKGGVVQISMYCQTCMTHSCISVVNISVWLRINESLRFLWLLCFISNWRRIKVFDLFAFFFSLWKKNANPQTCDICFRNFWCIFFSVLEVCVSLLTARDFLKH